MWLENCRFKYEFTTETYGCCWSRAAELTREVGQKASEQVMDVKTPCDLKVSKTGDLTTGNLLLSADGENDRLFGCTNLPHGNTFTCVFGDTLNRFHFTLANHVTLESSHGLLVKCRGKDVCLMGNPSGIIIYKVIRMNSISITNLPIPTLPHEAANKLYVDSNCRKILQGYVPLLRSMGGRNNIKLGFIATASSQLNNYYRASNAFNCFYTGRRTGGKWVSINETRNFFIQVKCPKLVRIWKIALRGSETNTQRIYRWQLEASTDDVNFVTLFLAPNPTHMVGDMVCW